MNETDNCPQCRSSDTTQESPLDYAICNYCTTEFYPQTIDDLYTLFNESTEITLPNRKTPITITTVTKNADSLTINAEGSQGASYKLILTDDHNGTLKRKKSPSEQNQFGSKWTNGKNAWPESVE